MQLSYITFAPGVLGCQMDRCLLVDPLRPWYVLFCLSDVTYRRSLAATRKAHEVAAAIFYSYSSGP